MVIVKVTMSNGNTLCQYELNTVQDGEEVLTNTKRAIKAINPDLDVDIYDEQIIVLKLLFIISCTMLSVIVLRILVELQMLRSLPLLYPYWGLQSFTKCY